MKVESAQLLQIIHTEEDLSIAAGGSGSFVVDLRKWNLTGSIWLKIIATTKVDHGLDDITVSIQPQVINLAATEWLTPGNTTQQDIASGLVDKLNAALTKSISFDLSRYFDDNGSVNDYLGGDGFEVEIAQGAGGSGLVTAIVVAR